MKLPSDQDASGRSFGDEEIAALADAIASGTLTATKGAHTKRMEAALAELLGVEHVIACASGSAAVHVAVAAIDPEPGDEIITTAITDMGALTPILYQGAIPVFADVDPVTMNVTAETIAARITPRTRAIIVTHLFGNPCQMDEILALGRERGIPIIEDSAQSYLGASKGRLTGTMGTIGCFSTQQGKHITSGEGGFVVTNDAALARRMRVFVNKAWPYGESNPDHEFIALNYRITELQSAVIAAQLPKLAANVRTRIANAQRLDVQLAELPGIGTPVVAVQDIHCYWRYCLRVDGSVVPGGPAALAAELKFYDIAAAPRYINKPAFRCKVFADQVTFGSSRWPFTLASPEAVDYSADRYPGTFAGLEQALVLPWNERYTAEHVDYLATSITEAVEKLTAVPVASA
jgi:dTDP-4-amino-4,6-dideoxygalactose transaminase